MTADDAAKVGVGWETPHFSRELLNHEISAGLPASEAAPLATRHTKLRFVLLATAAGFLFGNFYFFDQTSATEKAVEARTGMSEFTFGLLTSVYSWPNVLLPLCGGLVIDRCGVRAMALLYTALVGMGSCLFTAGLYFKSIELCVASRAIFGLGGESQIVASLALVAKWFRGQELAFATGILMGMARVGSVIAFDTQGVLSYKYGVVFGSCIGSAVCLLSLVSAVVCIWIDWWGDRRDRARGLNICVASADERVRCGDVVKFSKFYWLLTLSCVSTYVAAFPFMSCVNQPYLKERFGFNATQADELVANINLTSALCAPLLGLVVDKCGRRPLLLVLSSSLFVCVMIGFLFFPSCHQCWNVLPLYITMGIGLSVYGSVIWPCVPLVVDESVVGTAFGLMTALQNMGMAISPAILTYFHQHYGSFTPSFIYIIGCVSFGWAAGVAIWVLDIRGDRKLILGSANSEEVRNASRSFLAQCDSDLSGTSAITTPRDRVQAIMRQQRQADCLS